MGPVTDNYHLRLRNFALDLRELAIFEASLRMLLAWQLDSGQRSDTFDEYHATHRNWSPSITHRRGKLQAFDY